MRWKPGGEGDGAAPTLAILGLLGTTIGLQYFLLSSTSPLLQAWYWRRYRAEVPYRLFALSNFASLLSLLAYPPFIEPNVTLRWQSWTWSGVYVVFALLVIASAWPSMKWWPTAN